MITISNTNDISYYTAYTAAVSSFQNHFVIRYDGAGWHNSGKVTSIVLSVVSGERGTAETQ